MKGKKTGGRKRGTQNKVTVAVKTALQNAFSAVGGQKALANWAEANPTEFYKLWAKLLPQEITGADGKPLTTPVPITVYLPKNDRD